MNAEVLPGMPIWLAVALSVLTLLFLGVWGFLFYALFAYFKADGRRREAQHQLRLTRIRSGLPPR